MSRKYTNILIVGYMKIKQRISAFVQLGKIFKELGEQKEWSGYDIGLSEEEYQSFSQMIKYVKNHNGWFTEENVRQALLSLSQILQEDELNEWLEKYSLEDVTEKQVGIVMAGNIPLVGFHDVLCVLLSGHKALLKLSKDDAFLWPGIHKMMKSLDNNFAKLITIVEHKLENYDAVIATGSDNTARYFEQYFSHVPLIIRKNRTSVAVLNGEESPEELYALGQDIFNYFGLGCRNVSKLLIPENYDLDLFFKGIYDHHEVINHVKYANNYDYHKTIYLMNQDEILENGFVVLKESEDLHSPLGVLYYQRFKDTDQIQRYLEEMKESVQCVVGSNYIGFGEAQCPGLADYADGMDTMEFLKNI